MPRHFEFQPLLNSKNSGTTQWTKDNKLIFETAENQQATLWLTNVDENEKQPVTQSSDGIYLFPSLSQDGNFITFTSNRSGSNHI